LKKLPSMDIDIDCLYSYRTVLYLFIWLHSIQN
jgi:hypothetical protein